MIAIGCFWSQVEVAAASGAAWNGVEIEKRHAVLFRRRGSRSRTNDGEQAHNY